jgi:hypothetical protein
MGHKGKQTGLQYKLESDPWTGAWTGNNTDENGKEWTKESWQNAVGRNKGMELTYDQLNPFFKDTIFEKLINRYKMYRTRLMWISKMSCYSIHTDSTPRIHVPIITNPQCFFVFREGIVQHLSAGSVYRVNTTKPHTFMNCSDTPRLHLIGCMG